MKDAIADAHMHPAHQARIQYEAMAQCGQHSVNEAMQRCERCLGTFQQIHAQHDFIDGLHQPEGRRAGFAHIFDLQEA
jgi:hypothetical protein